MSQVQFSHNPLFCIDIIKTYKPDFTPRVAFILGSGLGALADQIENAVAISYEKLPGFPVSTVHGHAGELVLGHLQGVPVVCMKGRGHFYEGRGMTIMTDAIRTFKLLGCELLFCTNAAGSLRPEVGAGSLVALKDHINTMPGTPMVGLLHLELSSLQLYIASGASLLLSAYALTLPKIPVAEKKATTSLASKLGLDAFVLFKNPRMAIFFLFAMMLGAVLQITNVFGNPFLHDFARNPEFADSFVVKYPSILLSVSQMAEVGFILTIPFFLKRFGIKTVMLMSMVAWTLRFGFFAYGDPSTTGFILLLLSMIVYGCAFDFFNISGSVFVEQEVDSSIRASAQGLFMTMVNGVGAWVGSILSGMAVDYFSVDGVKDWQTIWLVFAGYALFLAVIFFFGFKYNHDPEKIKHRAVTH